MFYTDSFVLFFLSIENVNFKTLIHMFAQLKNSFQNCTIFTRSNNDDSNQHTTHKILARDQAVVSYFILSQTH